VWTCAPWRCSLSLLEIEEAVHQQKPIVLLELKGLGQTFSFDDAFAMLEDLETSLPPLNPWALSELRARREGEPLSTLQQTVRGALETARARTKVPTLNIHGTENQLEAELLELVESLATATARTLKWTGGSLLKDELARKAQAKKVHIAQRFRGRFSSADGAVRPEGEAVYLLHASNAEDDALRLSAGMGRTLAQPCELLMPSRAAAEMAQCLEHVVRAKYVVLLQTESALAQPWVLLAAYRAALAGVAMVCVVVSGRGYDFAGAKEQLEQLDKRLGVEEIAQLSRVLSSWSPPKDVASLQANLAGLIPNIISVGMDPAGTDNQLAATVRDIRDKHKLLSAVPSRSLSRRITRRRHVTRKLTRSPHTTLRHVHFVGHHKSATSMFASATSMEGSVTVEMGSNE
jgi:hypothetical protein